MMILRVTVAFGRDFPQLQSLDFSFNGLSHLFDPIHGYKGFQRLKKLRTLDLSGNNLNNSVLPFLSASRSLVTLNLSGNELEGVLPWSGLIDLRELEVLDLSYNIITDIEDGDGLKAMKLKTLDLSFNRLSEAARLEIFKDMSKLQVLDLTGNGFINLDSLGVVFPSSLQVLSLAYNQLSLTPKGYSKICALVNLRELDLSINALTNMPYCLAQFMDFLFINMNCATLISHITS
ncbi:hypothetical protein AALP_AA1G070300 [Arabis alpina]|uniref:Leucine-rich repeat-containing N-terminal plant-type domain-containing protein n=1 Tax=Arabis alpina TaxID=50452 RepID=A0A087HLN3_ARAAL|nr:hypothetical protein AALP_AA1G070300 [Arabis alpina]